MANSEVKQMGATTVTETLATSRKTGWFPFKDLDKTAVVRRLNAIYSSADNLTVKIYADGDSSNAVFSGVFRANNGASGVLVDDSNNVDSSTTTLPTDTTTKFKTGDWIKIDNEIMKIITAGTTSHTVQRGMRGTTAASHNNNAPIHYANYPNESLRIGRRAKYMSVEVSTIASTTATEISKMEIEYE